MDIHVTWWKGHKENLEMASNRKYSIQSKVNCCKSHELSNWGCIKTCRMFKKDLPKKIHPPAPSQTTWNHHFQMRNHIREAWEQTTNLRYGSLPSNPPEAACSKTPPGHLGNSNFVFSNSSRFVAAAKAATFWDAVHSVEGKGRIFLPYWRNQSPIGFLLLTEVFDYLNLLGG